MNHHDQPCGEDEAWLFARARGEPAAHPDPERAEAYLRLEKALGALPMPRPRRGWQGRVFAAIDRRALWAHGWASCALPLLAASVAIFVWRPWRRPVEGAFEPPILASSPGAPSAVRGSSSVGKVARASLGDSLIVRARLGGAGELRVYHDGGELVLRCPGDAPCGERLERGGRRLEGRLTFGAPGRYRAVLLGGALPRGGLPAEPERDALRAAAGAGLRVVDTLLVEVR